MHTTNILGMAPPNNSQLMAMVSPCPHSDGVLVGSIPELNQPSWEGFFFPSNSQEFVKFVRLCHLLKHHWGDFLNFSRKPLKIKKVNKNPDLMHSLWLERNMKKWEEICYIFVNKLQRMFYVFYFLLKHELFAELSLIKLLLISKSLKY